MIETICEIKKYSIVLIFNEFIEFGMIQKLYTNNFGDIFITINFANIKKCLYFEDIYFEDSHYNIWKNLNIKFKWSQVKIIKIFKKRCKNI